MAENQLVTLCTVPDRETGERIAQALVEARLAACVNLVPGLSSIYRWEGKVEKQAECLLIIKTTGARFEALQKRVLALHPYDMPEIIAIPISTGSTDYLKWISDSLK
jgi:periplasmic divalent cation tolerance protein